MIAAHADWSVATAKRWMSLATRGPDRWIVQAPCPVGDPGTLLSRLRCLAGGDSIALGVDFPLGLPRAYAAPHAREPDFLSFLRGLAHRPGFFLPCAELAEITPGRPFYPVRGRAGMTRAAHAACLGLPNATSLSRLCDRATASRPAGASLFWTLGANQTGKAALAAWRDLLLPALDLPDAPRLWPFDGDLLAILRSSKTVIAETYPAEAMRQLDVRLLGSKARRADRGAVSGALARALDAAGAVPMPALRTAIDTGFGPEHGGDDGFDSLLGLLCVLAVLNGRRPDGIPSDPWLRRWEGWVLGQTDMPRPDSGTLPN